jgi:ATP-binding cassette subfamily A (ABC1) protein 3
LLAQKSTDCHVTYLVQVAEKGNRSKFLQVVSGVRSSSYWAATFAFDFCLWTTYVSVYVVILQIFQVSPFTGPTGFALWIIMLVSGAATLVMVYCWSCKLSTPSSALGASIIVLISVSIFLVIGWVTPTIVMISNGLPLSVSETYTVPLIIALVFVSIFPPLSMLIGGVLLANMLKVLCSMGMKPDASATFFQLFVLINVIQIVIYTVLLFVLESRSKQSVTHSKRDSSKDTAAINDINSFETDADVKAEHDEVFAGKRDGDHVVAKCLRQEFSSPKTGKIKVAVAGISFSVKKGEVLGILGPNGAGKTSTLSILTSDHMPVGGTCAICQNDSINPDAVRRCIGVCPQHDALFMHMTPTENIYLFARLRGIPEQDIEKMCCNLLRLVKMEPHAHVLCGKLSGGNKRKISLVVSLIGVPPVIFMDEPSSGMDIIAKRFFWRVIEALRSEHAIILTTHSMEEAESVCSRVGIIVDGKMKCLGSLQRIKSVYGTGYDVQLKPGLENQVPTCKTFMESKLPASILVEEHGRTLKYTVPRESVASVSSIFETVGKLSLDIGMSEFGVCQTSLEQVFLHFGKQQRILLGQNPLLHHFFPATVPILIFSRRN